MERIEQTSSWNDPPTDKHIRTIAKLCMALGIRTPLEESPANRREARNMLYRLRIDLKNRPNNRRRRV